MSRYSSTEPCITISLADYQSLTLDSRVLSKALDDGWLGWDRFIQLKDELHEEDMRDGYEH